MSASWKNRILLGALYICIVGTVVSAFRQQLPIYLGWGMLTALVARVIYAVCE